MKDVHEPFTFKFVRSLSVFRGFQISHSIQQVISGVKLSMTANFCAVASLTFAHIILASLYVSSIQPRLSANQRGNMDKNGTRKIHPG